MGLQTAILLLATAFLSHPLKSLPPAPTHKGIISFRSHFSSLPKTHPPTVRGAGKGAPSLHGAPYRRVQLGSGDPRKRAESQPEPPKRPVNELPRFSQVKPRPGGANPIQSEEQPTAVARSPPALDCPGNREARAREGGSRPLSLPRRRLSPAAQPTTDPNFPCPRPAPPPTGAEGRPARPPPLKGEEEEEGEALTLLQAAAACPPTACSTESARRLGRAEESHRSIKARVTRKPRLGARANAIERTAPSPPFFRHGDPP